MHCQSVMEEIHQDPTAKVTVHEVARAAGVSASTVSRVLNGTARVSESKRATVEATLARMNYSPNLLAQGLKKGRATTIGIVVQHVYSPFFGELLRGVEGELSGTDYASVVVSGHWDVKDELKSLNLLLARQVDGIIILSGCLSDEEIFAIAAHRCVVATGRNLNGKNVFGFALDNEYGAHQATAHLIELGHRRIVFVAGPKNQCDANDRLLGYQRALREAGIKFDKHLVLDGDFNENSGVLAVNLLLESRQNFTAVFSTNDQMAYGVRLGLFRRGIRVPDDISLVGFDDLPGSSFTTPPLTTVRQPMYDVGRLAANALIRLINGEQISVNPPKLQLIIRETTRRVG